MKIAHIVSDFDNTLVGPDQILPEKSAQAIKAYCDQGGIFSIATGRAYEGLVQNVCHQLNLKGLHIVRGGSEIIDSQTNRIVWGAYIKPNLVSQIIDYLNSLGKYLVLAESGPNLYTKDGVADPEFATGASVKDIKNIPPEHVPKIAIPPLFSKEDIEQVFADFQTKFPLVHSVKTTSHRGVGIDINAQGAGKHVALLKYAQLTHTSPSDIMGVGDSYNDYPLLSACGTRVVMGNAPEELKSIADHIVGTQQEQGIVEAINLAL